MVVEIRGEGGSFMKKRKKHTRQCVKTVLMRIRGGMKV